MLPQKIEKLLTGNLLHNLPGNHIVRIRVLPLRPRLKIQRLLRPPIQNLLRRRRLHHRSHQVILRPVILIPRRMAQNLPDRDLIAPCKSRHILAYHIVQLELALLLKNKNGRRRKLLRNRPNRVPHLWRSRHIRIDMRPAISMRINQLPTLHHRHRSRRHPTLLQHIRSNPIDAGPQRSINRVHIRIANLRPQPRPTRSGHQSNQPPTNHPHLQQPRRSQAIPLPLVLCSCNQCALATKSKKIRHPEWSLAHPLCRARSKDPRL